MENNSIQEIPYIARLTSPIIMTHTGLNAVGVITLNEKPTHWDKKQVLTCFFAFIYNFSNLLFKNYQL